MLPDDIIQHCRDELRRWLEASEVPQHEIEAEADRLLVHSIAGRLSRAMFCMSNLEPELSERQVKQLYFWD